MRFYDQRARLRIGAFSSIAAGTTILLGAEHSTRAVTTSPLAWALGSEASPPGTHSAPKSDVVIGSDVWIGCGAIILSGVEISDGAVIGAGSVVRRSVPPYAVVTGNPAEVRRYRFDDATIKRLLEVKWWDWPRRRILGAYEDLVSDNVSDFLDRTGIRARD